MPVTDSCVFVPVSEYPCVCVSGVGQCLVPRHSPPHYISLPYFPEHLCAVSLHILPSALSRENYKCLCPANNQGSFRFEPEFIEEESIFLNLPDPFLQKQRKRLCGEAARGTCL